MLLRCLYGRRFFFFFFARIVVNSTPPWKMPLSTSCVIVAGLHSSCWGQDPIPAPVLLFPEGPSDPGRQALFVLFTSEELVAKRWQPCLWLSFFLGKLFLASKLHPDSTTVERGPNYTHEDERRRWQRQRQPWRRQRQLGYDQAFCRTKSDRKSPGYLSAWSWTLLKKTPYCIRCFFLFFFFLC